MAFAIGKLLLAKGTFTTFLGLIFLQELFPFCVLGSTVSNQHSASGSLTLSILLGGTINNPPSQSAVVIIWGEISLTPLGRVGTQYAVNLNFTAFPLVSFIIYSTRP